MNYSHHKLLPFLISTRIMHKHNIKQLLLIVMLAIGIFAFASCADRNKLRGPGDGTSDDSQLDITVSPDASNPEHDITSLRMLVFNAQDKSLLVNTKFEPSAVYDPIANSYLLKATIKNIKAVRVFVIANERATWTMEPSITYAGIKKLEADYYDKLNDQSNVAIPFLMLASIDQDIPTPPAANIERNLSLVRNVVKVSLSLRQKLMLVQGSKQEGLTFKRAFIERVPKKGFLFTGSTYDAAQGFTQTAAYDLEAIGSSPDLAREYSTLNQDLTFYIPEHILTDKSQYSRLIITATKNTTDDMSAVTYEIPLGNGVQKLYDPISPITKDQLTTTDLSAARNTHFVINATVGLFDISTSIKVKDWIEKEIQGEITAPYLNISSIEEDVRATTVLENGNDRVIFDRDRLVFLVWTNLSKEDLMLNTTVQRDFDTPVALSEVFDYTWTVTEAAEGFLPNVPTATGKLELKFKNPNKIWAQYKLKVSAKNLSRSIVINTNYFDISTNEQNVTIKDVNGKLVCEPEVVEFKFTTNYPKDKLIYNSIFYKDSDIRSSQMSDTFIIEWTKVEADPINIFEARVTGTLKLKLKSPTKTTVLYKMSASADRLRHDFQIRANF